VLNAQKDAAAKRRRIEAQKRHTTAVTPPSISRAYGKYISHVCFLSVLEVAHAVRCSPTAPTRASLNQIVEDLKNVTAHKALASANLPAEPQRVKGNQLDMYIMLTQGEMPPDELRYGPQDVFFKYLEEADANPGREPSDVEPSCCTRTILQ
jgi:hypothetical protein